MNSPQDLTWGAEKTEQLIFALDIGATSSEFGEHRPRVSKTHSGQRRCPLLSPSPWEKGRNHDCPRMEGAGAVWRTQGMFFSHGYENS